LGVKAGMGGQGFNPTVLEKIKKMRKILGETGKIGVDGGLNGENIKLCQKAGANVFYIGTDFWQTEGPEKRYNELLQQISNI